MSDQSREIEENGDNNRRSDNVIGVKDGASIAYEMIRTTY